MLKYRRVPNSWMYTAVEGGFLYIKDGTNEQIFVPNGSDFITCLKAKRKDK